MALKRMVLEIGMGTDIRGADSTKAAERAVRDALWRNTLSIATLMGKERSDMHLEINIGVPNPETVNKEAVMAVAPYGKGSVKVVEGGLRIPNDDGTDSTILAHALVVVSLDV
jgi:uncharacterized protein (TIGR02058 family)